MNDTVFRAIAEPTIFMDAKFRRTVHYFSSSWRAFRWGRRYVRRNPHGEVLIEEKTRRGRTTPNSR